MAFNNTFDDGESDSGARILVASGMESLESDKDTIVVLRVDPDSVIFDAEKAFAIRHLC